MGYVAKKDFLWFHHGDEVKDPAQNWISEGLVELEGAAPEPKTEPSVASAPEEPKEQPAPKDDMLLDNYLDQNTKAVVKAIASDALSKEQVAKLLEMESKGKKRRPVLDALKAK